MKTFDMFWPLHIYGKGVSLALQTGLMMMSSAEVVDRRTQLVSRSLRGEIPFPVAECMLMWQEKLAAHLELVASLNRSFFGEAAAVFQNLQGLPEISQMLSRQIHGIESALKPYNTRTFANMHRLRKTRG